MWAQQAVGRGWQVPPALVALCPSAGTFQAAWCPGT